MDKETIIRLIAVFEGLSKIGRISSEGIKHLEELKQELERIEDEAE